MPWLFSQSNCTFASVNTCFDFPHVMFNCCLPVADAMKLIPEATLFALTCFYVIRALT